MPRTTKLFVLATALLSTLTACSDTTPSASSNSAVPTSISVGTDSGETTSASNPVGAASETSLTLIAYDSFVLSKGMLEGFTAGTGIKVTVLTNGDTGEMVNKAILTKDAPLGDVLWGVDNLSLQPAIDAKLFAPYDSVNNSNTKAEFLALVPNHEATPVDYGDVCVNVDDAALQEKGLAIPTTFEELTDPKYKDLLVVENPATSAPGLSFLLATIAKYGESGWVDYWTKLKANGVSIVNGWTEAYETAFSGGSGKGSRPMVVSYGTSPPAGVLFGADPNATKAPTSVMIDTCFRSVEFSGVLAGTKHVKEAQQLVDFLSSVPVQEDIPLNMFVYPTNSKANLPKIFVDFAAKPTAPLTIDPKSIAAGRQRWIDTWTSTML
jgi:thiamine transport system substrate-binding protein